MLPPNISSFKDIWTAIPNASKMTSISVIIPAHNAAKYLDRCLQSCVIQKELSEIIMIDDGSTDHTPQIINSYKKEDPRIITLQHINGLNKGRSASRNLGIKKAKSEWITFCDADDYYLPERFKIFVQLEKTNIDGTYEAVGSEYESSELTHVINPITTVAEPPSSALLLDYLIAHREERISLIGLIVRKSLVEKAGYFDEALTIGEDTDFIWNFARHGNLAPLIQTKPVVIRQVHHDNTYTKKSGIEKHKFTFYKKWKTKISELELSPEATQRITSSYNYYKYQLEKSEANLVKKTALYFKYKIRKIFK